MTRRPMEFRRTGTTLLELIVVISAIAIIASVSALVMPRKLVPPDDTTHRITNGRAEALRTGRPVRVTVRLHGAYVAATMLPDGMVLVDTSAHVARLTGHIRMPPDTGAAR
ncbi:MAG: hypothetical protein JWM95_684 [Gemmatimonadetes bacterium]|nr:hypothetical protein [Gemmatimonadota bacterium]